MSNYTLKSPIDIVNSSTGGQINIYPSSGSFSVQLKSPSSLSANIPFTFPSSVGSSGQFLKLGAGSSTSWSTGSGSPTSSLPVSFCFQAQNGSPNSTASTSFKTICDFYYGGTTTDNTISSIKAVVETSNTIAQGQVRIFDLTNSNVIANSAAFGPTNGVEIIVDLGAISNLPTSQAIFEVQFAKVGGSGSARLYSIAILG